MKITLLTCIALLLFTLAWCSNSKVVEHSENDGHTNHATWEIHSDNDGHTNHEKKWWSHDMKMTIDSEDGFLVDMIPHHQEAIDTSIILVAKTQNKQLRAIAQSIVDTQTKEVTMMKDLLTKKYPTHNKKSTYMSMMDPNLEKLNWIEQEKSYLNGMIAHHAMAVDMAKQLLEISQEPELVLFAETIITTQSKEIKEMKHILEDMDRPAHEETGDH